MKIIKSKFEHNLDFTKYFVSEHSCFLDIETLGLNRNKHMIYLVGILYFSKEENLWYLEQYFAESMEDEQYMLQEVINSVKDFKTIITYNGNSFDLPYLNKRLSKYNINFQFSIDKSLDLYAIVRNNKQYLNLENYKLKTLEKYIGIYREDIYSGRDCIEFYKEYLLSGDNNLKDKILQHNYDDLFYMLDLFSILDIIKDKKTIYIDTNNDKLELIIEDIKSEGDFLIIHGNIKSDLKYKINYYGDSYSFIIDEANKYLITIEYKKGMLTPTLACLFVYNKEFSIELVDETNHKTPNGVILLQIGKKFMIENIKNFSEQLIKSILV